ncbi:YtcA family lipoprotein [Burkholderia sp. D-99]|uniref:YtcA family lipoprotein n=1 Tax=Burkholderia sp. D-99 TaxID=2717316 RepID=UPI001FB8070B|nr:YtcA family lipoprotein [Burkholderia sp. D-99]
MRPALAAGGRQFARALFRRAHSIIESTLRHSIMPFLPAVVSPLQMRSSITRKFVPLAASLLLGGCVPAPSVAVFGAAFPDWLFCIVFGVLGTVIVHVVLGKRGKRALLAPLAISYPALCALLAMACWLLFFPH